MVEAEDAAHAADPAQARPNASSDDEGEELGRVRRILAIPLVPFVALWEAARLALEGSRQMRAGSARQARPQEDSSVG